MPLDATLFPPVENSRRTQIATTTPTYAKVGRLLEDLLPGTPRLLDYGAGRGLGSALLGCDSLEPHPPATFTPTFTSKDQIEAGSYDAVVCLHVLNVVPPEVRREIVLDIARVLRPGGAAVIVTRGRDVLTVKNAVPGPEPMSRILGEGDAAWYQKGFTQGELLSFIEEVLDETFTVEPLKLGTPAVLVRAGEINPLV
jgi:SAM-dependent methyltransferase